MQGVCVAVSHTVSHSLSHSGTHSLTHSLTHLYTLSCVFPAEQEMGRYKAIMQLPFNAFGTMAMAREVSAYPPQHCDVVTVTV